MPGDERAVVERAKQGEYSAFEVLVRLFQGRVRAYFASRLGDPSLVDDLSQEVFLISYRRLASFDSTQPFYPWLKGIAANVLSNELRRTRPLLFEDPESLEASLEQVAARQAERMLGLASERATFQALRDCVGRLGGIAARVIEAKYLSGFSIPAIAEQEAKSPKALSMILVRIRRNLRKCVENELDRIGRTSGVTS